MTRNIFTTILSVAAFSLLAVSCSEDDGYTPAEVPDNNQVYFNYNDNRTYLLEENQASISVKVYRIKTDQAVSVPYATTVDSDVDNIFQFPATIDFAAGQSVTDLVIGIDFATVQPRYTYNLTLEIDESEATLYGDSSCSLTVEYFPQGDPMRDAICGFYTGEGIGSDYWTNTWYQTTFDFIYGEGGVEYLRLLQGEENDEVLLRNFVQPYDDVTLNDIVGKVTTFADADEAAAWWGSDVSASWWGEGNVLLGYITFEPQVCGTYTIDYYGIADYDLTFAAAWYTGAWATTPTDPLYVPIVGVRNADGSYEVNQIDFTCYGWCLKFEYPGYGWYYAAYGQGVLDLVK